MDRARLSPAGEEPVAEEAVRFRGHPMVRALHPTTIEVTTEEHLTPRGDCIIGVAADKGCGQLSEKVKAALREKGARVRMRILVGGLQFVVNARGDPGLALSDNRDLVVRRSSFLSDRTLAVHAEFAACDIPRPMVRLLTDPSTAGTIEIAVS